MSLVITDQDSYSQNFFERLPRVLKYKIFACFEWNELSLAKSVCKEWQELLNPSSIQNLISCCKTKVHLSPSFLVKVLYKLKNTENVEEQSVFLSIDHEGKCQNLSMLNSMKLETNPSSEVISNGFIFIFSKLKSHGRIVALNPSLNVLISIPCNLQSNFTSHKYTLFKGAHYDPSSFQFGLIIGFKMVDDTQEVTYKIHIYSSQSQQWRSVSTITMPKKVCFEPATDSGMFSEGCYYWIEDVNLNYGEKGVMAFSLLDEQFHRIPLPECPYKFRSVHGCFDDGFGYFGGGWNLKGCEGNVVLFHCSDGLDFWTNGLVAWRLNIKSGFEWIWEKLSFQISNRDERDNSPFYFHFDTNHSNLWLWAQKSTTRLRQSGLKILDEHGETRLSIPVSTLISVAGISDAEECDATVAGIRSFEVSNIWSILESS